MKNQELYISVRKSLDSYRDVVLNEIELIEDEGEKENFARDVQEEVKELLGGIAKSRGPTWKGQNPVQAQKFRRHAQELSSPGAPVDCPPGFELKDGICVRI